MGSGIQGPKADIGVEDEDEFEIDDDLVVSISFFLYMGSLVKRETNSTMQAGSNSEQEFSDDSDVEIDKVSFQS